MNQMGACRKALVSVMGGMRTLDQSDDRTPDLGCQPANLATKSTAKPMAGAIQLTCVSPFKIAISPAPAKQPTR